MVSKRIIRSAKKNDVICLNGKMFDESFRGVCMEVDGEVLAIAGILHTQELQGFILMKDKARNYPRLFVKGIRKMKKIMKGYKSPIYATPKPTEKTAKGLLKHIGFKHYYDEVYQWTP